MPAKKASSRKKRRPGKSPSNSKVLRRGKPSSALVKIASLGPDDFIIADHEQLADLVHDAIQSCPDGESPRISRPMLLWIHSLIVDSILTYAESLWRDFSLRRAELALRRSGERAALKELECIGLRRGSGRRGRPRVSSFPAFSLYTALIGEWQYNLPATHDSRQPKIDFESQEMHACAKRLLYSLSRYDQLKGLSEMGIERSREMRDDVRAVKPIGGIAVDTPIPMTPDDAIRNVARILGIGPRRASELVRHGWAHWREISEPTGKPEDALPPLPPAPSHKPAPSEGTKNKG